MKRLIFLFLVVFISCIQDVDNLSLENSYIVNEDISMLIIDDYQQLINNYKGSLDYLNMHIQHKEKIDFNNGSYIKNYKESDVDILILNFNDNSETLKTFLTAIKYGENNWITIIERIVSYNGPIIGNNSLNGLHFIFTPISLTPKEYFVIENNEYINNIVVSNPEYGPLCLGASWECFKNKVQYMGFIKRIVCAIGGIDKCLAVIAGDCLLCHCLDICY
ncbi:MAG: hypothetical protein JJU28_02430 [Cyclobacteriaceae bacterium]|nr:hypothetical protein [Cyclobacteriaceae bacterium]